MNSPGGPGLVLVSAFLSDAVGSLWLTGVRCFSLDFFCICCRRKSRSVNVVVDGKLVVAVLIQLTLFPRILFFPQ